MAKSRFFQLCVARDTLPGVATSLDNLLTAANAKVKIRENPTYKIDPEYYRRDVLSATLSPSQGIPGVVEAELSFGIELSGTTLPDAGGTAVNSLVWAALFEACGLYMGVERRKLLTVGTFDTGFVFENNEIIRNHLTLGSATEFGRVVHNTYANQSTLRFMDVPGLAPLTAASTTIVGNNSGTAETVAGTAIASDGTAFIPASEPEITLDNASITGTVTAGDELKGNTSGAIISPRQNVTGAGVDLPYVLVEGTPLPNASTETYTNLTRTGEVVGATDSKTFKVPTLSLALLMNGKVIAISGARGTFKLSAKLGQPILVDFTFKGVLIGFRDQANILGVSYESPTPPKFMGIEFKIGSTLTGEAGFQSYATEHTPKIESFEFDWGREVQIDRDATQATGLLYAHHTGHAPKFTFDPGQRPEAVYPFLKAQQNGESMRARVKIGTLARNRFLLSWGSMIPTTSPLQDRRGFSANAFTCDIDSRRPSNGADGDDNEFAMTHGDRGTDGF